MRYKELAVLLSLVGSLGAQADNIYVKLYEARLETSKIVQQRRAQQLEYHLVQLERHRRLFEKKATSAAELEELELAAKVAALAVRDAELQVLEAATMRDIARERTSLGLEMPICPGNPAQ